MFGDTLPVRNKASGISLVKIYMLEDIVLHVAKLNVDIIVGAVKEWVIT